MIRPQEVERLKDLNSPQADALVDLCRPRVLVVAKAPYAQIVGGGAESELLSFLFSDGLGSSGLLPGDVIRGEVFGTFTNDNVAGTIHEFGVKLGAQTLAAITYTQADLALTQVSWRARFVIRLQGGEGQTINSPAKQASTTAQCYLSIDVGDTGAGLYSVSQALSGAFVTVTDPTLLTTVNLAVPLSVKLRTAVPTDATLTIYGGAMEGL